jgi:hypothetical protein
MPSPSAVEDRVALRAELSAALDLGDFESAQKAASAYLHSLGYPGPIDASLEADAAWGGARFSYVMRDLALVSEAVGEIAIATDLYRRANPGGGMCGTSVDYRRGQQLRGLVRSAERAGKCSTIVAERLLDWEDDYNPPGTGHEWVERDASIAYGPGRLVEAGFDVARLYRGAMVFANREVGAEVLTRVFSKSGNELGRAALRRLADRGPEAWEERVRAVEGLADVGQRDAVTPLAAVLPTAGNELRARTLAALGALTRRFATGPCGEDQGISLGGWSNIWSRPVTPLRDTSCEYALDDDATARLARKIVPYLDDEATDVRTAAIEALGDMAASDETQRLKKRRTKLQRVSAGCREDEEDADRAELCSTARWEIETIQRALESIRTAESR